MTGKNALVSTVKMFLITSGTKATQRPQLHTAAVHTKTDAYILPPYFTNLHIDIEIHAHSQLPHTRTNMYDRHTWYYIAVGIKSALTSNVSVMHTVGPNSYNIYKPNHDVKTTRFSIETKKQHEMSYKQL